MDPIVIVTKHNRRITVNQNGTEGHILIEIMGRGPTESIRAVLYAHEGRDLRDALDAVFPGPGEQ